MNTKKNLQPIRMMLWSKETINFFYQWSKFDTVYLDATGRIVKKAEGDSGCFYIYELVVKKSENL